MRIGFCGAHRTGKTTLAKAVADKYGYKFLNSSATGVFERFGVRPDQPLSIGKKFEIQSALLDDFLERVYGLDNYVTDRTPLDYIGYMMAELSTDACSSPDMPHDEQIEFYLERCHRAMEASLDVAFRIPVAIPIVHEAGKGVMNKAFIDHVSSLINVAVDDGMESGYGLRYVVTMPKPFDTIESRMQLVSRVVDDFDGLKQYLDEKIFDFYPQLKPRDFTTKSGSSSLQ